MAPYDKNSRKTARAVLTAIRNLHHRNAATLKNIHNYIQEKCPRCRRSETQVKHVIDKAVAFGAVERMSNKYVLGGILRHIVKAKRGRRARRTKRRAGGRRRRRRRHL